MNSSFTRGWTWSAQVQRLTNTRPGRMPNNILNDLSFCAFGIGLEFFRSDLVFEQSRLCNNLIFGILYPQARVAVMYGMTNSPKDIELGTFS